MLDRAARRSPSLLHFHPVVDIEHQCSRRSIAFFEPSIYILYRSLRSELMSSVYGAIAAEVSNLWRWLSPGNSNQMSFSSRASWSGSSPSKQPLKGLFKDGNWYCESPSYDRLFTPQLILDGSDANAKSMVDGLSPAYPSALVRQLLTNMPSPHQATAARASRRRTSR